MRHFILVWVVFLMGSGGVLGQEVKMLMGPPNGEEIGLKVCPYDTSASAVVLQEFGVFLPHVNEAVGFIEATLEIHRRIKIFKKEGYKAGNVEIEYYDGSKGSGEEVKFIQGATYNVDANGNSRVTKLEEKNIFDEKVSKRHRYHIIKFALPELEEGSVIEYSYTINSPLSVNSRRHWAFQSWIPKLWSQYQMIFGAGFDYQTITNVKKAFTVNKICEGIDRRMNAINETYSIERHEMTCHVWAMHDIPAFKEEEYMTASGEFSDNLDFQLKKLYCKGVAPKTYLSDYPTFVRDMLDDVDYGRYIKRTGAVKEIVKEILTLASPKNKMDSIGAIRDWVAKKIYSDNEGALYADISPKDLLEKKRGNSTSINLMLIAMLREAGLEANPVLLGTRSYDKPNAFYPFRNKFNYTLAAVKVDTGDLLVDGVYSQMPLGMVPFETLNGGGLLMEVKTNNSRWIPLKNSMKLISVRMGEFEILPEGILKGSIESQVRNYDAVRGRSLIAEKGKEAYIQKEYGVLATTGKIDEQEVGGVDNLAAPLRSKVVLHTADFMQVNGDLIYVNPLLAYGQMRNPFKLEDRTYPVDFGYPSDEQVTLSFTIPEGYVVEDMPKSARHLYGIDGSIKFDYLVEMTGRVFKVTSKFSIKRAVFEPGEYKDLKAFYTQVVGKSGEQLVLKKK